MDNQYPQQTLPPQQPATPPQNINPVPQPQQSYYGKRNWIKWGLIYLFIAVLIYGGIYYLAAQQKKSSPYSTNYPSPTISQPSPTPDETANWKTYENTKYGYQLKYPPTWQLQDNSDSDNNYISFYPPQVNLALNDPGVPSIDLQVTSRPLSSYPTENLTQGGIPMITDWKTVSVNGINGIYYQVHQCAPQCYATTALPINQQKTIGLSISTVAQDQGYTNIYNQILSTFKFAQ